MEWFETTVERSSNPSHSVGHFVNTEMLKVQVFSITSQVIRKVTKGSSHCGSVVTNPTSIHEDAGSIPCLAQWVKDLSLPWAMVWVADMAQIWCSWGWGAGQLLQLQFNPGPGNFHMLRVQPLKKKKKKKRQSFMCTKKFYTYHLIWTQAANHRGWGGWVPVAAVGP